MQRQDEESTVGAKLAAHSPQAFMVTAILKYFARNESFVQTMWASKKPSNPWFWHIRMLAPCLALLGAAFAAFFNSSEFCALFQEGTLPRKPEVSATLGCGTEGEKMHSKIYAKCWVPRTELVVEGSNLDLQPRWNFVEIWQQISGLLVKRGEKGRR